MAKGQSNSSAVPVYDFQDGYLAVRKMEDDKLDLLLQTYAARIEGYKVEDGDKAINVTMKIAFPTCSNRSNAELWAWFIVKAAHATAAKPRTLSTPVGEGWTVFMSWPIWNGVKYMESTRKDNPLF